MRHASTQPLSIASIRQIFRNLESGDGKGFFDHVADDVDGSSRGRTLLPVTIAARLTPSQIPSKSWQRSYRKARNCTWNMH